MVSPIVAVLILVGLHELGHFPVACWCGVKVVRSLVGSGKPLLTKKHDGTEWRLAPIPLGSYVKTADACEGSVVETDSPLAFDRQHPAKRIVIVATGSLTNLILMVVLYGLSPSFDATEIRPYVGTVEPASIATTADFVPEDKISSVNGKTAKDWSDVQTEILLEVGSRGVDVVAQTASGQRTVHVIDAAGTSKAGRVAKNSGNIRLRPLKIAIRLGPAMKNGSMERTGLKVDDRLLTADGKSTKQWLDWADLFRRSPGNRITTDYECGGKVYEASVRPDVEELPDGTLVDKVDMAPQRDGVWDKWMCYQCTPSVPEAFRMGWDKVTGYSLMTTEFFDKLTTDRASLSHISGPLIIADVVGRSTALGIQSYLEFLALVSVSLGVMNLLPVPALGDGHLVHYTAEWVRGKPSSERIQAVGLRFGLIVMLVLMLAAFLNDIDRLFG